MMDPKYLLIFGKVVECGGITPAARILSIPKATVSRAVTRIEKHLSTRLLERSSKKTRLTESGGILFEYYRRIADEIGRAEAAVSAVETIIRGKLRVAAPFTFGQYSLSPILADFLSENPDIEFDLELTNRRVDPVEEAFDLVVRVGALEDSMMVAKRFGDVPFGLFATQQYLRQHNSPHRPKELERHSLIGPLSDGDRENWTFVKGNEKESIKVSNARLAVNDPMVRLNAALGNVGIALLPLWMVRACEEKHKLRRVLPGWQLVTAMCVTVLYPSRRSLTRKSRAFISFLEKRMPSILADDC